MDARVAGTTAAVGAPGGAGDLLGTTSRAGGSASCARRIARPLPFSAAYRAVLDAGIGPGIAEAQAALLPPTPPRRFHHRHHRCAGQIDQSRPRGRNDRYPCGAASPCWRACCEDGAGRGLRAAEGDVPAIIATSASTTCEGSRRHGRSGSSRRSRRRSSRRRDPVDEGPHVGAGNMLAALTRQPALRASYGGDHGMLALERDGSERRRRRWTSLDDAARAQGVRGRRTQRSSPPQPAFAPTSAPAAGQGRPAAGAHAEIACPARGPSAYRRPSEPRRGRHGQDTA